MQTPRAKERPEETFVRELFSERFRAVLHKVPEGPFKTPDFELVAAGCCVAVLEVKRMERTPRTPENGWTRDKSGFMTAEDNGPARVGAALHGAWKQLRTREEPKVMVFVNDEPMLDVKDLEEAYNGRLWYGASDGFGYFNTASRRVAEGRIRAEKSRIDMYVWVDRVRAGEASQPLLYFRYVTEPGAGLALRFFGDTTGPHA